MCVPICFFYSDRLLSPVPSSMQWCAGGAVSKKFCGFETGVGRVGGRAEMLAKLKNFMETPLHTVSSGTKARNSL